MRTLIFAAAALAVTCFPAATLADDAYDLGKKKAEEVCAACHGADGNKPLTPETPRLGGQYYDYLYHSLAAYKSGKRQNAMMAPMAQPLTKQEMKALAWYFSKQTGLQVKY